MNTLKSILAAFTVLLTVTFGYSQVNQIALEQTPGAFATESLTLAPGTYQFNVTNKGVDHEVGFVLAPKGKTEQEHHIADAYVSQPIKEGATESSKAVTLEPGEYVYFCPLNPTELYPLTVSAQAETVTLVQTPGAFETEQLQLKAGQYQFEIMNKGVDHAVGFVIAPKGMTDMDHHIKSAYVTSQIDEGKSATSQVVDLKAGEYVYFCPLNPTEQYPLTVK